MLMERLLASINVVEIFLLSMLMLMERLLVSINAVDGVIFLLSMQAAILNFFWHMSFRDPGFRIFMWVVNFLFDWFVI